MMLPLSVLIGAALVDGALLGGARFPGPAWAIWAIVGGLAALVIATLAAQVRAAAPDIDNEADHVFAAVDGQTELIAAALVTVGFALLLGAWAPRGGLAFVAWAGIATAAMGFSLAIFKCVIGARRTSRPSPEADAPRRDDASDLYSITRTS
jgi:hypothetical protein